jgi:hypothetical protein
MQTSRATFTAKQQGQDPVFNYILPSVRTASCISPMWSWVGSSKDPPQEACAEGGDYCLWSGLQCLIVTCPCSRLPREYSLKMQGLDLES